MTYQPINKKKTMIEKTYLYDRSETVFVLNINLGMDYVWQHILMLWTTTKEADYSVLNCGIRLFPSSNFQRSPLYHPDDVAQFIKDMRARFPEMAKPFKFAPSLYEVETAPAPTFMHGMVHKFRKAKPVLTALPVGV